MARQFRIPDDPFRHVLVPFNAREATSVDHAAKMAGYSTARMRRLASQYGLGRRLGNGRWHISRVAVRMFLDGDAAALAAYHAGRRDDPAVRRYLTECGLMA